MTQKVHGVHRPAEVLSGNTDFYSAFTLVDITDTGNSNPKGNIKSFKQAQNLNTLIQILSMRTQLVLSSVKKLESQDLTEYDFGSELIGTHDIWILKFATETTDVWKKNDNPVYFANMDCSDVPVNTELDETAVINHRFETSGNNKNLYFTMSEFI